MRIIFLLAVPLLAVAVISPTVAPAQVISIPFGARIGPEVRVFSYSQDWVGDWRSNYRRWKPVTVYDINGRYYARSASGARPVIVYKYNNEYFFPPQDRAWDGADHRYDYSRQPSQADYARGRSYAPGGVTFDKRLGKEVGVLAYSEDRAGGWRTNVARWTAVKLFEVDGRYYPKNGPGARQVSMYRYKDEYFLPPLEQGWVNSDKRFDYTHRPIREDYDRARFRP